jgi:glycine C-acetyltransferase/8-amino-7-oxononanoate synthase
VRPFLKQDLAETGDRFCFANAAEALKSCEQALQRGVFAQAIRPPTVPEGTCRLRLAVMASHRSSELRQAARVLGAVVPKRPVTEVAPQVADGRPRVYDGLAEAA